jgi:hypothetical protein
MIATIFSYRARCEPILELRTPQGTLLVRGMAG